MYMEREQEKWMDQNLMREEKGGLRRDGVHLFSDKGLDFPSQSLLNVFNLHETILFTFT